MSSLYRLDVTAAQIAAHFQAEQGLDPWSGDYVAPGRYAPVILRDRRGGRSLAPRQWGVPPAPRLALDGGRPVTSVRNLDSPFWVGTLRHTEFRCLVPATSFHEWGDARDPATDKRSRHWFHLPASPLFAFAGIWRDSEVPSFAILSCDANRLIGAVREAGMPAILHPEHFDDWLRADWKSAQALIAPFPSQLMAQMGSAPPFSPAPEQP